MLKIRTLLGTYVAALVVAVGCDVADVGGGEVGGARSPERSPGISLPFDLDGVVQRARLSFREENGIIAGGRDTYRVEAFGGGFQVTPYSSVDPDGEPAMLSGAPLALETISIARGSEFELPEARMFIGEDGRLNIDRGVAIEQLANDEASVEQSWIFDRAPSGEGDLVVRVRFSGQSYAGWSEDGHHFIDEATGVGLRYGVATWVDANGQRASIEVLHQNDTLVLTVPSAVIEAAAYPATLDPTIGAELGTTFASGPSAAAEELPAIAFDGSNYFVVWADTRSGESRDIYGARVDASGALVDLTSSIVNNGLGSQASPAIAFNGTRYLVVWQDGASPQLNIRGAYLSPNGTAGAAFDISTAVADQQNASVAWDGSRWIVVWQDGRGGVDHVYYTLIDENGAVLHPEGVMIAGGDTLPERLPKLACGVNCMIVWCDGPTTGENIHAARVSGSVVLDTSPLVVVSASGRNVRPDVAYDGRNYFVVWQRGGDIRGRRFNDETSSFVEGSNFLISTGGHATVAASGDQRATSVEFDGTQFMVVWQDARLDSFYDIYGARVDLNGVVRDLNGVQISQRTNGQTFPVIAGGGGSYFVVWQDARSGNADIYGTRVMPGGNVASANGLVISRAAPRQNSASVVYDGRNYLVVYADSGSRLSGADDSIRAFRVSYSGNVLDPNGGRTIIAAPGPQTNPDVAYSASTNQFLIAWSDKRGGVDFDVWGVLMSGWPSYTISAQGAFPISSAARDQSHPAVAWNANPSGPHFVVAWEDSRGADMDIYAARTSSSGVVLDAGGLVVGGAINTQSRPDVASDGTDSFVVWSDNRSGTWENEDVYGALVFASGLVGPEIVVSAADYRQELPKVVHNGSEYFVVWSDTRHDELMINTDIYAARVSNGGAVVDSAGLALAASPVIEWRASVAASADKYFVTWVQMSLADVWTVDLYGRRFAFDGVPVEMGAFAISTEDGGEDEPAVAARNGANALVAYHRFVRDGASTVRVRARRVLFP